MHGGARYRMVLADDVPDLRYLFKTVLEETGVFEVVGEAGDGRETVELAKTHQPDLILLDVSMPVLDGMAALPLIHEASPNTKVVILSGFDEERLAELALAAGASAYLEKGIPADELITRLIEVVRTGTSTTDSVPARPALSPAQRISSDELLSFLGHEIRNPLTVIKGLGDMLVGHWDTLDDERRRDLAARIAANGHYLDNVIGNLIQMRSDAGDVLVHKSVVDVPQMLEDLSRELSALARQHPVELELREDLPRVETDVHRVRQVLTNLVTNAGKYSPEGEPITLRALPHDKGAVIEVQDRGPGIPLDQRESVFGKFVQLDTRSKGLGLGLYICRVLMDAVGGGIWIGESDEGTRVCLLLPEATEV